MTDAVGRDALDALTRHGFVRAVLGGTIEAYGEGRCTLALDLQPGHRQFLGGAHGGIIGALADDACAWACASEVGELVTASYTLNILTPATGDRLVARGRLIRAGRRLAIGQAEVFSVADGIEHLVAIFQGTNARLQSTTAASK